MWVGVPIETGKGTRASDGWAGACRCFRQPRRWGTIERIQRSTQLTGVGPGSLIVLGALRYGGPIVVEPAVGRPEYRRAR